MGKPLVSVLSLSIFSLACLLVPCGSMAQRKPRAGKQAVPAPAAPTPAATSKPATSKPATSHQKAYRPADRVPAAAGTHMVDKFTEPTRNHGYDTVYVSTQMTTYLIFPTPIRLLDLGSKNYAGRIEQNKLLLKPVRGFVPSSAMMVETQDGQVYLHYIAYRQQPERIFWDYRKGTHNPLAHNPLAQGAAEQGPVAQNGHAGLSNGNDSAGNDSDSDTGNGNVPGGDPKRMYSSKLSYLKRQKRRKLFYKKENNIAIRISGLAVDNTATYMLLEVDNQSSIPYKLEYVSFAYQEKRKRKTRSKVVGEENQVLPMLSQTSGMVRPRSSSEMAYAFPLFANTLKGKLEIIVRETDGNRVVRAHVPAKVLAKSLYIPNSATASTHK